MSGAEDVFTDDDTANAEDRMRQAEYGTVRDWNGRPSTPSPLPDETPFSVDAERASRPPEGEAALREAAAEAATIIGFLRSVIASGEQLTAGDQASLDRLMDRLRAALAPPVPADDRERRDTTGVRP